MVIGRVCRGCLIVLPDYSLTRRLRALYRAAHLMARGTKRKKKDTSKPNDGAALGFEEKLRVFAAGLARGTLAIQGVVTAKRMRPKEGTR